MKLSYSGNSKYGLCPRKYKHHYIDRLRTNSLPSPLFFGGALDEAFSRLLLEKKPFLTDSELDMQLNYTAEECFERKMLEVSNNGELVKLAMSPHAEYFSSDFSPELIAGKQLGLLQLVEKSYSLSDFIDFHESCKEQLRARKKLQKDDQILYNYLSWLSLVEKGKLMVSAYRTDVLPQISTVYDIQKPISIKNEDGDEINGLIDVICSFTEEPDRKFVTDNKSSSKPYEENSVVESEQLATYCEAEKIPDAAFIVVQKKLFKKSPVIRTQVITGTIPEEKYVKTFDMYSKTVYNVQTELFPQNWDSCFAFGRTCEFFKLCKYNKMDGLIKMDKK